MSLESVILRKGDLNLHKNFINALHNKINLQYHNIK